MHDNYAALSKALQKAVSETKKAGAALDSAASAMDTLQAGDGADTTAVKENAATVRTCKWMPMARGNGKERGG